jgi:L-asparaginase
MRPYEFRDSDALQNVTEALLAGRMVPPGVYVSMHNRVLEFPGVAKDRKALTFVKPEPVSDLPAAPAEPFEPGGRYRD